MKRPEIIDYDIMNMEWQEVLSSYIFDLEKYIDYLESQLNMALNTGYEQTK